MTASVTGTPTNIANGGNYTAESGSLRAVVLLVGFEEFNSVTVAPTMGAQAFTASSSFIEGSDRSYAYVGYILEADIPSGSQVIALNESAAIDDSQITMLTVVDIDQSTPVAGGYTQDAPATAAPSLSITGVTDGLAVAVYEHEATSTITEDAAWTLLFNNVGTNQKVYTAYKLTSSGADTFEPTLGVAPDGVLAALVLNSSGGGGGSSIPVGSLSLLGVGV